MRGKDEACGDEHADEGSHSGAEWLGDETDSQSEAVTKLRPSEPVHEGDVLAAHEDRARAGDDGKREEAESDVGLCRYIAVRCV